MSSVSFKLKPTRHARKYVEMHVWDNKKEMKEYLKANEYESRGKFEAICVTRHKWNAKTRWHPSFAEIHVHRHCLYTDVIAHEITHAAVSYLRFHKVDVMDQGKAQHQTMPVDCGEEKLCYAIGRMVAQAVWQLKKRNIKLYC